MPYLHADEAPTQAEREHMPAHVFGLPDKKKYPLDTVEHVHAAASYGAKEHNAGRLSDADFATLSGNIAKAKKRLGLEETKDAADHSDGGSDRVAVDPAWERVKRLDLASGEFRERRTGPQGFGLAVTANLTRTGVFHYQQPDGTVRRELRLPEEVFDPESLKTLRGATITDDHPAKVDSSNYKRETIGHVDGTPHKAGKFVQGELHIKHDAAIDKTNKGRLSEISCGYDCAIEPTSGSYEGEPYDAIQRHIRYNHVAAGPPGWGRAGPEVRMHLDGGAGVSGGEKASDRYVRDMPTKEELDAAVEAARKEARAEADKRFDAIDKELATLKADNSRLAGENAGFREQTDRADKATKSLESQKRADAELEMRLAAVIEGSRILGPEWSYKREDGGMKTVVDIHKDILGKLRPKTSLDGRDAAYIAGMCQVALEGAEENAEGQRAIQEATNFDGSLNLDAGVPPQFLKGKKKKAPAGDDDGDEDDDEETSSANDAQAAMVARQKDAWKPGMRKRDRARMDVNGMGYSGEGALGGGNRGNGAGSLGGVGGY